MVVTISIWVLRTALCTNNGFGNGSTTDHCICSEQEFLMLKIARENSAGNEKDFHQGVAYAYVSDPSLPFWSPSKALYHYEQLTKIDHYLRSLSLYNYATILLKRRHQCGNHNCTRPGIKRCEKCKYTHYCSHECQRKHWSIHKLECNGKKLERQQEYIKCRKALEQAIQIEMEQGFSNPVGSLMSGYKIYKTQWQEFSGGWIKSKEISDDSTYSRSVSVLCGLLRRQFNETQNAIDIVIDALKYERNNEMKTELVGLLLSMFKDEGAMLEAFDRQSQGDRHKFHHAVANLYSSSFHPLWNPSKAFYHFEQSIQGNHFLKSYFLCYYAQKLIKLSDLHNIHQCDNNDCTMIGNQTCSKCKKTYYCSRKCQVKHWKSGHKLECHRQHRYAKARKLLKKAIEMEQADGFSIFLWDDSTELSSFEAALYVIRAKYVNKSRMYPVYNVHKTCVDLLQKIARVDFNSDPHSKQMRIFQIDD